MRLSGDVKSHIRRRAGKADREAIADLARSDNPAAREIGQAMLEATGDTVLQKTDAELRYPFSAVANQAEAARLLAQIKRDAPALTEFLGYHFLAAAPNYLRRCVVAYNWGGDAFARCLVQLLTEAAEMGMVLEAARREQHETA